MKKKNILLTIMMMAAIFYAPSVFAASKITGCESVIPGAIIDPKIPNTVHIIITVIKVAVPIVLVIMGMLDLFKGITAQKEDEMAKGRKIFVKRLISAAIIFFVISIVQLLISFVGDNEGIMSCANCFINGANTDGSCK